MIITTDLEGRIVTFNPAGERMMGYSQEEVQGRTVEEIWKNPKDRKRLMEAVQSQGAVNNFQATLIAKNGQPVEISLSLSLLRNRNGQVLGTVGISKDVTEENRLRRQLIESERLAAIGQTVAGLTHCIKNILNGLKGGSYLIDIGLKRKQNDLVEEGWQTVQKGISRIQNLSLDMLTYCRPRVPEYQSADPLQLAMETVALVSQAARQEGIDLQVAGPEGLLADLDPLQIGRALLNLVANALDACREKNYSEGERPSVQVIVDMEGDRLKISVRDNGIGMSNEVKSQLFKRFFSTKEPGGTGLGLSVTDKIISEHGGTLQVDSTPGRGTTFTILLPVSTCQA
jgi:PAS domain S-box-containing protein